jgi:hypothetical protein
MKLGDIMYKPGDISDLNDYSLPPWERGVRQGGLMNKEVAHANLKDFVEVFNEVGIRYVLIFGTLLGAVRDGDFIYNDSDTDVLCFREDYQKIDTAIIKLSKRDFYIPLNGLPMLDHYFIRNGEKIDINWILDNGHGEMLYADWIRWDKQHFQFPLDTMDFRGMHVTVPRFKEQLLEVTYGSDWRIPKNKKGFMG